MDKTELAKYMENPNVKWVLYNILKHESGKIDGKVNTGGFNESAGDSTAYGSGQFIGKTRNTILSEYGIDAWADNLEDQQLAAIALIHSNGHLDAVAGGDYSGLKSNNYWEAFSGDENHKRLTKSKPTGWEDKYTNMQSDSIHDPATSWDKLSPEMKEEKKGWFDRKYGGMPQGFDSEKVTFDEDRYVDIARREAEGETVTKKDLDWKKSVDDKWIEEKIKGESDEKDSDFVDAVNKATKRSRITEEEEQQQQDDADFKKSISDPKLDSLIAKKIKNGDALTKEEKKRKEWTDTYEAKKRGEEYDELVLRGDESGGLGEAISQQKKVEQDTTDITGIAPTGETSSLVDYADDDEKKEKEVEAKPYEFDVREARKLGLMYDKDGRTYDPDQLENMFVKPEGLMDYEEYAGWLSKKEEDPSANFDDYHFSDDDFTPSTVEGEATETEFDKWLKDNPGGTREEFNKWFDLRGDASGLGEESFLDKMGGLSSLIGLATGAIGLGQALKKVDIPKDPKLGPAFQQRLSESKRLAKQGLTPSELAKAHNDLDSSYATGIENIVRGSAGNRAQFLAGLGGLDVARQSALMDIAVSDASMQRDNQQKYDSMMMMNEQYEAARTAKHQDAQYQQDSATKAAGAALAGSAFSMVNEAIGNRHINRYNKIRTERLLMEMGYKSTKDGKSGQKQVGEKEDGSKTQTSWRDEGFALSTNILNAEDQSIITTVDNQVEVQNSSNLINTSFLQESNNANISGLINPDNTLFEY